MGDNLFADRKMRENKWFYIFLVILSFVWVNIYSSITSIDTTFRESYGNIFSSSNLPTTISYILGQAIFSWIIFEVLFYFYRYILAFKVYSFIVPKESMKAEGRLYFALRNFFIGIFYNLCFLYPYLMNFVGFVNIVISMIVLVIFASNLNKNYSDKIIGHFVFKCFVYPIFVYEAISILFSFLGVLIWKVI